MEDLVEKTVEAIRRERQRVVARNAVFGVIALAAIALATFWWFLASFHLGFYAKHGTRRESLAWMLPGIAFINVVVGMAAGATLGRLGGWTHGSRRRGFVVFVTSAALIVGAYRFAQIGIRGDLRMYAPATAAMIVLAIGGGYAVGADRLPFKRLYRGRALSGVLRGISEEFGWNTTWLRLIALVLLFVVGGPTVIAYLLLDSSMQVHPEDRAHMWRFRIARWLRRAPTETRA